MTRVTTGCDRNHQGWKRGATTAS